MGQPDFWLDRKQAEHDSRLLKELTDEVTGWKLIEQDIATWLELSEIAEEANRKDIERSIAEIEERYRKLEFSLLLSDEYDQANAILAIHAGTGGTDAMDWAEILERMMMRF